MHVRGIRGAVRVASNDRREIFARTQVLLRAMLAANRVRPDHIAAAFFTMTPDLNADFPAYAARDMGWAHVPMICATEVAVPGAMDRLVRVLLLVNTTLAPEAVRHQYLGETRCLRPDLAKAATKKARQGRLCRAESRHSSRSSSSTNRSDGGKR